MKAGINQAGIHVRRQNKEAEGHEWDGIRMSYGKEYECHMVRKISDGPFLMKYLEMICPEAIQERGLYNLSLEYVEKCLEIDQSIETKRSKWGKTPVCFYTVVVGIILAIAGKEKFLYNSI